MGSVSPVRQSDALVPVSRHAIELAIEPSVTRRYAAGDQAWHHAIAAARREWFWRWLRTRFIPGPLRRHKQVKAVSRSYASVWTSGQLPGLPAVENSTSLLRWCDDGLEVRGFGEKRVHLLLLQNALAALAPSRVLEVGSGNGFMSMMLSAAFPHAAFTGVELTAEGVAAAREVQREERLPSALAAFAPYALVDEFAFKRVTFQQGDATALPFLDKSFDVVFTSLALEQMNRVLKPALREIRRVARSHILMLEPFSDFNRRPEQRYYTQARDYFDMTVADLASRGFRVVSVFADFPCKMQRGVGFVVAERD